MKLNFEAELCGKPKKNSRFVKMGGSAASKPQTMSYNKITDINDSSIKRELTREESAKLDLESKTQVTSAQS